MLETQSGKKTIVGTDVMIKNRNYPGKRPASKMHSCPFLVVQPRHASWPLPVPLFPPAIRKTAGTAPFLCGSYKITWADTESTKNKLSLPQSQRRETFLLPRTIWIFLASLTGHWKRPMLNLLQTCWISSPTYGRLGRARPNYFEALVSRELDIPHPYSILMNCTEHKCKLECLER